MNALPEHSIARPFKDLDGADLLSDLSKELWAQEGEHWMEKLLTYLSAQVRVIEAWGLS